MDNIKEHARICAELHDIYKKKNSDYGNSFSETFEKLGIISAITRISDKYNRLCSLATKPKDEMRVKDESLIDTLKDMANYCIMTAMELEKDKKQDYEIIKGFDTELQQAQQYVQTVSTNWGEIKDNGGVVGEISY